MLDRFRERARSGVSRPGAQQQRRITRHEREERQKRLLYIATGVAGAVVIIALLVGAAYQYYFFPRDAVASVNGEKIERRDYWKVRELQLRQNLAQIGQQYQITPADQRPQLEQQAQEINAELDDLRGADLAEDTISAMVDNLIVMQQIDDLGIEITDDEVDEFVTEQFAPAPVGSPTPTPPVDPTAAAWATATGEANAAAATETAQAQATAAAASPTGEVDATPDATGTPEATGTAAVTPTAEEQATETVVTGTGTPDAEGTPSGSPEASPSPTPSPTVAPDDARATAESRFDQYTDNFLEPSDMSREDYNRLIVRPELARNKVREQLESQVALRGEQVHAAHILVATEEAAQAVVERLNNGEDFAAVAQEVSTDTQTAANGGDLGWFPRGVMVDAFEEAAFSLQPDQVSDPVQSTFGWHIIKVFEREDDRPLTLEMVQSLKVRAFNDWLQEQRTASDIDSDVPLTTLQRQQNQASDTTFQAPPDAPLPPTPTPAPSPTIAPASPTP